MLSNQMWAMPARVTGGNDAAPARPVRSTHLQNCVISPATWAAGGASKWTFCRPIGPETICNGYFGYLSIKKQRFLIDRYDPYRSETPIAGPKTQPSEFGGTERQMGPWLPTGQILAGPEGYKYIRVNMRIRTRLLSFATARLTTSSATLPTSHQGSGTRLSGGSSVSRYRFTRGQSLGRTQICRKTNPAFRRRSRSARLRRAAELASNPLTGHDPRGYRVLFRIVRAAAAPTAHYL